MFNFSPKIVIVTTADFSLYTGIFIDSNPYIFGSYTNGSGSTIYYSEPNSKTCHMSSNRLTWYINTSHFSIISGDSGSGEVQLLTSIHIASYTAILQLNDDNRNYSYACFG